MRFKVGFLFCIGFLLSTKFTYAASIPMSFKQASHIDVLLDEDLNASTLNIEALRTDSVEVVSREKNKGIAIALAVTLGVFGVHRLYLGTANKVPIIYTLTLGGGFGVLVLSDILAIIATKDINTFSSNEKVFMWAK